MAEEIYQRLAQAVIDGEAEDSIALSKEALEQGLDPLLCISEGLTPGIQQVDKLFASGEYYLPDLIIGGDAMKAALDILEPMLVGDQNREVAGRVVLGTVQGDLHEIGKTLVGTMLTANGFEVTDIGIDQPASELVAAVEETKAVLVGASALLTTTMLQQKKVVEELKAAGFGDDVKVIIGGAPVTQSWAEEIGADGYAEDAISAVGVAKKLVGIE
ncbi:MAG: corrinoid protein [Nitrosomonadaceae bacterium]